MQVTTVSAITYAKVKGTDHARTHSGTGGNPGAKKATPSVTTASTQTGTWWANAPAHASALKRSSAVKRDGKGR
jgi:hypothetical protein